MFYFFKKTNQWLDESDFLVKSAFGVSVVSFIILFPFAINNFLQDRPLGGTLTLFINLLCLLNAWLGWHGKYSLTLNLLGVVPAITLAIVSAIVNLGVMGSYWAYLGVFSIYFILPLHAAKYANVLFLTSVIVSAWMALDPSAYLRFSVVLIGVSFFIFISNREISKAQLLLKKQLVTDALTGTLNRVQLSQSLQLAIKEHEEQDIKATLCVLDIDHFKSINDTYGHDMGDKVLVELSQFILTMISSKDMLFRIGGEEFLILMNDTNAQEGEKTADALRAIVEDLPLITDRAITISIGVTEIKDGFGWKEWMKLSDEKLYTAKQNGRNQVVI